VVYSQDGRGLEFDVLLNRQTGVLQAQLFGLVYRQHLVPVVVHNAAYHVDLLVVQLLYQVFRVSCEVDNFVLEVFNLLFLFVEGEKVAFIEGDAP